jgi:hypothetical protein
LFLNFCYVSDDPYGDNASAPNQIDEELQEYPQNINLRGNQFHHSISFAFPSLCILGKLVTLVTVNGRN